MSRRLWCALLCGLCLLAGCGTDGPDAGGEQTFTASRDYAKGPLEMTVSLSAETIALADTVLLKLDMRLERGYALDVVADDLLGQDAFVVRDVDEQAHADTSHTYSTRIYTLEPNYSGTMAIPALSVAFRADEGDGAYALKTEALEVAVTGLSDEDRTALDIRDIHGPRPLPREWGWLVWTAAALLLTAALCAAGLLVHRRRRHAAAGEELPYERALRELEELSRKDYIETAQFDRFYYEITWIIRSFIAAQFGINAPESTSEEFLRDMEARDGFPSEYKPRLRDYLDHCDLVKYARHTPATEEIDRIFNVTRDFILFTGVETARPTS